jgi:hypothetical protein
MTIFSVSPPQPQVVQALGIIAGRSQVMNRTRSHHHKQAWILAVNNALQGGATLQHELFGSGRNRQRF